jgi:hypothetical protein
MQRKQREFDDARLEFDLSVEKWVQESLAAVRDKAKLAKKVRRSRFWERKHKSLGCSARSRNCAAQGS